ncbi:hypothetical protein AYO22_04556 [Fonsecaea multimorphosa]|nr:hypothetical protein AYO22_04556 [Fonsecaea multimorphosa]
MDENILQSLSSQRSQECQLIDLTLGKLKKLHASELAILGDLYREDRWRWTPEHGLQVGLPQDLQVRWFSRESVWDLQNRIRPLTLPGGDPDPNADRRLEKQEYVWLLSQMLHYKLGFALTPIDAAARIAAALLTGNVQQPDKLKRRAQKLRRGYQGHHSLRSTGLQLGSAVNEETSRFDGESEGEQELEDGVSNEARGRAHSSVDSGLERLVASEKVRADKEAVALDLVERDDNSNVGEACPDKRKTPVMVSTNDTSQIQGATRSNLSNLVQKPWVSHIQTLKPQDPLPPVPQPGQFGSQTGTAKHAKGTQTLPTPETDASVPPRSHNASSFGSAGIFD